MALSRVAYSTRTGVTSEDGRGRLVATWMAVTSLMTVHVLILSRWVGDRRNGAGPSGIGSRLNRAEYETKAGLGARCRGGYSLRLRHSRVRDPAAPGATSG